MGSIIPLGIAGMVVAFLTMVLSGFPITGGVDINQPMAQPETDDLDIEAVEEMGNRLSFVYCSIIEDIASFQSDPSVARANARRDEFVGYSKTLATRYQEFASQLQDKLDVLALDVGK